MAIRPCGMRDPVHVLHRVRIDWSLRTRHAWDSEWELNPLMASKVYGHGGRSKWPWLILLRACFETLIALYPVSCRVSRNRYVLHTWFLKGTALLILYFVGEDRTAHRVDSCPILSLRSLQILLRILYIGIWKQILQHMNREDVVIVEVHGWRIK